MFTFDLSVKHNELEDCYKELNKYIKEHKNQEIWDFEIDDKYLIVLIGDKK